MSFDKLFYLKHNGIDVSLILDILKENKVDVIDAQLKNIVGYTTNESIFLDIDYMIKHISIETMCFIILHEYCHYIRFKKYGLKYFTNNLINDNFNDFANFVMDEEVFCDRWASINFFTIFKKRYNGKTQELSEPLNRLKYSNRLINSHKTYLKYGNNAINLLKDNFVIYTKNKL